MFELTTRSHSHRSPLTLVRFLRLELLSTLLLLGSLSGAVGIAPVRVSAEEVVLARDGRAELPIRIAKDASPRMRTLSQQAAVLLEDISGAPFDIIDDLDGAGLRLVVDDSSEVDMWQREDYSISSGGRRVTLSGRTDLAVEHAFWDLAHRLGYRQYFPGPTWEVIPQLPTIRVDIDVAESPDYEYRRIWYGYGLWDHNPEAYDLWCRRNRMGGSIELRSGHAYGGIIRGMQATFDAHPEFYALVDGQRNVHPQAKLCVGNPELRRTVVRYAQAYFAERPEEDSISMDPSDGGGWCKCDRCQAIGSPSDRALTLANEVAAAVDPRLVGMYAYNYHSSPPSIDVHPNVCINVATAFIKGGRSIDEILEGWSDRGATLGIREYYSVNTWDRDLPGASRGSNLKYLQSTIPAFHAQGARFMNAESSDNWGPNGLGYYFAARSLWDLSEADRREEIVDDFLSKAFGPAREPMRTFYTLIDGSNKRSQLVYEDLLARMYRSLESALNLVDEGSPEQRRIQDLILYSRYVELFDRYRSAKGPARQEAFEALIQHVYRMRDTMLIHAKAIYRDVPARDKTVKVPENCGWQVPAERNPWKSDRPFTEPEVRGLLAAGISNNRPVQLDFEVREFSDKLRPAMTVLSSPESLEYGEPGIAARGRGPRSWYTWFDEPGEVVLHIRGGLIAHYRDRGNVKVSLVKLGGASESGESETLVATDRSVPPDGQRRTVRLAVQEAGLYRIDLNDGMDLTEVSWPDDQPMAWKLTLEDHPRMFSGRWSLYFYVPLGTERIGLYVHTSGGRIVDPDGNTAADLNDQPGSYLSLEVPHGNAGRLWKLDRVAGKVCLLNVPPYAARSGSELLLPTDAR